MSIYNTSRRALLLFLLFCISMQINFTIREHCLFKCRQSTLKRLFKSVMRVSMGLTVRRKTAKNLAVRRKNERILAVSRKKN